LCQSHFNLSTSLWVQQPCFVPYNQIESAQALVHVALAVITVVLSIIMLYGRLARRRYTERNCLKQPKITVEFANGANGTSRMKNSLQIEPVPNTASAYMNSSYDAGTSTDYEAALSGVARPQNGYVRQSARRPRIRAPRPPSSASAVVYQFSTIRVMSLIVELLKQRNSDEYSAATTVEAGGGLSTNNGRLSRSSCREIPGRRTRSSYLDEDWMSDYEDAYAKPKQRSGSMKSFKLPATEGVRRMLSHEQVLSASSALGDRSTSQRCSASNLTSLVSFDPKSNTLIRVREHFGDEEVDSSNNGFYEIAKPKAQKKSPTASVATPSSSSNNQESSAVPKMLAPSIDRTQANYASRRLPELPSTASNPVTDYRYSSGTSDWSQDSSTRMVNGYATSVNTVEAMDKQDSLRISTPQQYHQEQQYHQQQKQQQQRQQTDPKSCRTHIGYEPALCDPLPTVAPYDPQRDAGIPLAYEPIYRSSTKQVSFRSFVQLHRNLTVSTRRCSARNYHENENSLRLMAYECEPRGVPPPSTIPIINDTSLLV
uniref:Serine-rich adhesin for platelets n=1 Tax=Anisakis simplex TaxID=6269 RepID=A0A0M3K1H6_ANISI